MMSEPDFPSLLLTSAGAEARGAFARAQADFLDPDSAWVSRLDARLAEANTGVVAHFYMDAELQGALFASQWPHIHISDSLLMADAAVKMAEAGVERVVVLGVDFMSENVRAMLDVGGHQAVQVLRASEASIGCSLAESAERPEYAAWLQRAAQSPFSLHVVYINTSLRTKAHAHATVPTITCTSSNVVRTILQAASQEPRGHIWFGPDTYMGRNLKTFFEYVSSMSAEDVAKLHPDHTPQTVASLLERFHYFEQGNCFVHHLFGDVVAAKVRNRYPDAYITAHLEVPGEMFALGLEAQNEGRGVVGSTSDILRFIESTTRDALAQEQPRRCRFVLGTEAGMVTSIVRCVRALLEAQARPLVEVEIIFPVNEGAVAATGDAALPVVPGVQAGEGCSTDGGCATCPYMKMNSLDALDDLLLKVEVGQENLDGFSPRVYDERIGARSVAEVGGEPILFMRDFQRTGALPEALIDLLRVGSDVR